MGPQHVVPMLHVPDGSVQSTVQWYQAIGFLVLDTVADDGAMNWALLAYGNSQIMITGGGHTTRDERRDVDLYIHCDDVERLYRDLEGRVEIHLGLDDTFYGAREFVLRDPNRFWITFGQAATTGVG